MNFYNLYPARETRGSSPGVYVIFAASRSVPYMAYIGYVIT